MTIFGRLDGLAEKGKPAPEVPLVSVLRDTLGDDNPENDRLRYVWMLTYTQPSMTKRIAAAIPFFYRRVGNKKNSFGSPTPILNLAHAKRATWNRFFWWGVQNAFFDTYGLPLKASSRSYRQNLSDYRKAHVTQALSILGTFEKLQQRSRDESEFLAKRVDEAPVSERESMMAAHHSSICDRRLRRARCLSCARAFCFRTIRSVVCTDRTSTNRP